MQSYQGSNKQRLLRYKKRLKEGKKMFYDLRKPREHHLYFVYVHGYSDGENEIAPDLYRVGSLKEIKKQLRDQKRKFDVFKVW